MRHDKKNAINVCLKIFLFKNASITINGQKTKSRLAYVYKMIDSTMVPLKKFIRDKAGNPPQMARSSLSIKSVNSNTLPPDTE